MDSAEETRFCISSDDLRENLLVLHNKEITYKAESYLDFIEEGSIEEGKKAINEECYLAMGTWCYKIVEYYNGDADTAFIAMSHTDRFLSSKDGNFALYDRHWFKLVVLSSLQIAMKTNESDPLNINSLIALGKGAFSKNEIALMEEEIISALAWRLRPPTPSAFMDLMLNLFPTSVPNSSRILLWNDAKKHLQLCTPHYSLSIVKPSLLAITSLCIEMDKHFSQGFVDELICNINDLTDFRYSMSDILPLKEKILQLSVENITAKKEFHNVIKQETQNDAEKEAQNDISSKSIDPMKPKDV